MSKTLPQKKKLNQFLYFVSLKLHIVLKTDCYKTYVYKITPVLRFTLVKPNFWRKSDF